METFVVFTTLTPQGRKRIKDDPDRLLRVRKEVERLGGRIVRQYATVGGNTDFVTVVEAPDHVAAARINAEISALGSVRIRAFPAIKLDRFQQLLKMQPYRTEPHRWQTSLWAQVVRRAGRYWTTTRYVRQYCK